MFLFAVCFGGFLFGFFVLFQFWFVVFCCCWSGLVFCCCCFWVSFLKFHSLHACFGAPKKWGVHTNELNTSYALKQSPALRRSLAQGSGEISGLQILYAERGLLCLTASMVARPSYPSSAEENPFHIKYNYRRKLAANF